MSSNYQSKRLIIQTKKKKKKTSIKLSKSAKIAQNIYILSPFLCHSTLLYVVFVFLLKKKQKTEEK